MAQTTTQRTITFAAVLAGTALLTSACRVDLDLGDGPTVTGDVDVTEFTELEIDGAFDVTVDIGPDPSLDYEIGEEIEDRLEIEQNGDRLVIGYDSRPLSIDGPVRIHLTTADLRLVDAEGAVDIEINDLDADRLEVALQGAARVDANGSVTNLILESEGASRFDFGSVEVEEAEITADGASSIDLTNADRVTGSLNGASLLDVSDSAVVNVSTSGASSID